MMRRVIYYGILLMALSLVQSACQNEDEQSPELNLSDSSKEVSFQKNRFEIDLISDGQWELVNKSLWVTAFPGGGVGNGKIVFVVNENQGEARRDSVYYNVISGTKREKKYFIITQEAMPTSLSVDPSGEVNVGEDGKVFKIKIAANRNWTITQSTPTSWMELDKTEGTVKDSVVTVTVKANEGDANTVKLTVTAAEAKVELVINQAENTCKAQFTYQGETYKNVKMKDGRCWMAENLRYVPAGKTITDDFTDNTGVWYSQKSNAPEDVKKYGCLYNWETVLGGMTAAEKVRGICPEGYHVPSQDEFNALLAEYKGDDNKVHIEDLEEEGFSCPIGGMRSSKGALTAIVGYMHSSTDASTAKANQNKALLYSSGAKTASVVNAAHDTGISLRCVKDE